MRPWLWEGNYANSLSLTIRGIQTGYAWVDGLGSVWPINYFSSSMFQYASDTNFDHEVFIRNRANAMCGDHLG